MQLTKEQHEEIYNEIVRLYDLAEGIIDALESPATKKPEVQAEIAIPVVETIEDATGALAEAYITYANSSTGKASPAEVKKVEAALRKIFSAVLKYTEQAKKLPIMQ